MNCQEAVQIMPESVLYGSKQIHFSLYEEDRKTMRIIVTPELFVYVKAPIDTSFEVVEKKIKKRWSWILKQLGYFSSFYPKKVTREYRSWETYLYLGREYLLDIKITSEKESVKIKWKHLEVSVKDITKVKKVIDAWYSKNAKEKIQSFYSPIAERFKKYDILIPELTLRNMKLRWGSCTKSGKITLNSRLVEAPRGCIEYVIVHELCHLIHFGHTKKFYELQTKESPNWEKWKEKLERLLA